MTSKILTTKLGLRSPLPKGDNNLEKLKRENIALKKKLEESSNSKMSDTERSRLLQKILDLETQKVKNDQAQSPQGEIMPNRNNSLSANNKGLLLAAEGEARKIENLSGEIRKQIPEVPPRIGQPKTSVPQTSQLPPKDAALSNVQILEAQLKDALEKNQQWLVYDQQREAYVQGLMARLLDLEQQVASSTQNKQKTKEISCDAKEDDKQKYYDRLLIAAKKDLEGERQITAQLNSELSEMRMKLEEKKKETTDLSTTMRSLRESEQQRDNDRRHLKDKMQRQRRELDVYREMYDEEKRKNSELSTQIEKMQSSLLRQQEEQQKVTTLEQQILKCTSDLENEKIDRHNVQHQLSKVLKELRKTREQIIKLEPGKRDIYFVDTSGNFVSEFDDKLSMREKYPSPKPKNLLDESFLECPRCQAMYPTSQHRELLAHIDVCTS